MSEQQDQKVSSAVGRHWCNIPKKIEGPTLSQEEVQALQKRVPIGHADKTAICTRLGWERWQIHADRSRKEALFTALRNGR